MSRLNTLRPPAKAQAFGVANLCILLCLGNAGHAAAPLDPNTLEQRSTALLNAGQISAAADLIAKAHPPEHIRKLFHARLAKAQGQYSNAIALLRQAQALSPDHLPTRRELAHSLFLTRQHTEATRHLRHLLRRDDAPVLRASYRNMLRQIRAAEPFSYALRLTARPSTNINNGTSADQFETVLGDFTVNEDSRKTSGTGYSIAGQMRWQASVAEAKVLRLTATLSHTRYPSYQQLDKTNLGLSFGLRSYRSPDSWLEPRITAHATNTADGSDHRALGLGLGLQQALTHNATLTGDLSAQKRRYLHQPYRDGPVYQLRLGWQQRLSPLSTLGLELSGTHVAHRADHLAHRGLTLSAHWQRQINHSLRGSLWITHGIRRYKGIAPLSRDRRRERFTGLSMAVQFDRPTLPFGTPELRCSVSQTRANIALYSYNSQSCGLSLTAEF